MYVFYGHRVLPDHLTCSLSGPDRGNVISVSELHRSLDALSRYRCVSLSDFVNMKKGDEETRVALTFDDGFKDNLEVLLPILKDRDLPVTIFVTTRFLGGEKPFEYELWENLSCSSGSEDQYSRIRTQLRLCSYNKRRKSLRTLKKNGFGCSQKKELMLSAQEIKHISKDCLLTIGSHSHSHLVLSRQWPWVVSQELSCSKQYLEGLIEKTVDFLAYPYGACASWTNLLAQRAGYRKVFSTHPVAANPRNFCLPRIPIMEAKKFIESVN